MIKLKSILKYVALAGILSTIATTASSKEITIWVTATQSNRLAVFNVIGQTFEALNGDKVNFISVNEEKLSSRLAAASTAGNLPDILEAGVDKLLEAGYGGIVDEKSNQEVLNDIGKNRIYDGALKMITANGGKIYGLPYFGWVQGIWYRADWFKKAGLKAPDTWENILKAAKYFNKPQQNQYGILIGTDQGQDYTQQVYSQFAMSNDAYILDKNSKSIFNSQATYETFQFYKELAQYTPPGAQTWRGRDYYIQGKLAMMFYSTYILDDLSIEDVAKGSLDDTNFKELKAGKFDPNLARHTSLAAVIKHGKHHASYGQVVGWSILKNKDKAQLESIKKLLNFIYEKDNYIAFLHTDVGGQNPVIKGIAQDPKFIADPKGVFKKYNENMLLQIGKGLEDPQRMFIVDSKVIPAVSQILGEKIIPQALHKVIFEKTSIDTALKEAEEQIQKILKRQ